MENGGVDLLFLDINLPRVNGLEFLRDLPERPPVVLTTAYHQYALEGFELDVTDYLLKPIEYDRFLKAVGKVREKVRTRSGSTADHFFVKTERGLEKVAFAEILFVEAMLNYVRIQLRDRQLVTYVTLKSVEQWLQPDRFFKVQKSFIVAVDKIDRISGNEVIVNGKAIPISRANKDEIVQAITNGRILRRE